MRGQLDRLFANSLRRAECSRAGHDCIAAGISADPEGNACSIAETDTYAFQRHLKLIGNYLSKDSAGSLSLGRSAAYDADVAVIIDANLGAFERAYGRLLHIHANAHPP